MSTEWKVGRVARLAGTSVRTLHHYEDLGLLAPSSRSESDHRLYTSDDLATLQQILSLRDLGFPLAEIKGWLQDPGHQPLEAMRLHLERVAERIAALEAMRDVLRDVLQRVQERGAATPEQVIQLIERMNGMKNVEKYFSPSQLEALKQRHESLGSDQVASVEREWPELIAKVRAAMHEGLAPDRPEVLVLAQRWGELVAMFSGGDAGIERAISTTTRRTRTRLPGWASTRSCISTSVQRWPVSNRQ